MLVMDVDDAEEIDEADKVIIEESIELSLLIISEPHVCETHDFELLGLCSIEKDCDFCTNNCSHVILLSCTNCTIFQYICLNCYIAC